MWLPIRIRSPHVRMLLATSDQPEVMTMRLELETMRIPISRLVTLTQDVYDQ